MSSITTVRDSILAAAMSAVPLSAGDAPPAERLPLWNGQAPIDATTHEQAEAWITVYKPANPNGAAAVICPGGGYGTVVVQPEGHGIAKWLGEHGVTGIVLEYRLPAGRPYVPLLDAQRALRMTRTHAVEWGIDPRRLGIMGFSAGGHLASTAGTHFDDGDARATDPVARAGCRPDFMILVYPVITLGAHTHQGSRDNLLGRDPKPELVALFSNELQVTAKTPPAFLAHAQDDTAVAPINSELFHEALLKHGVTSTYLPLASGGHGLNGYQGPMWDAWQSGALTWLGEIGMLAPRADVKKR